ncbi:MAG: hypothetical protein RRE21_07110 [Desulfurococcales archaeon]|nr:hypothetical protein [Desulfurococcales archaeon]
MREEVSIVNAEIRDDNQAEDMPRNESLFVEHEETLFHSIRSQITTMNTESNMVHKIML